VTGPDPAARFASRLASLASRLVAHASAPVPSGLTDPDPETGERWDWGQVWAHITEFVPYWVRQARSLLAAPEEGPVPFGRTRADPDRLAAIERDRRVPPAELWERLRGHLAELRVFLEHVPPEGWERRGLHPALGMMDLAEVVERFLVGHLEEHLLQLDRLAAQATRGPT
jgi:hypothetical protein